MTRETRKSFAEMARFVVYRLANLADDLDPDWMGGSVPPRLSDAEAEEAIEIIRRIDATLDGRGERGRDAPALARMRVLDAIHMSSARMLSERKEIRFDLAAAIGQLRVATAAWCPKYADAIARVKDDTIEFALACWPNTPGPIGMTKVTLRSGERLKKAKMIASLELLRAIDPELECDEATLEEKWSTWRADSLPWRRRLRSKP